MTPDLAHVISSLLGANYQDISLSYFQFHAHIYCIFRE